MIAERVCVTCKYFPRTKKFLPYSHVCVCNWCVLGVQLNGFCPIHNILIKAIVTVYS